MNKRFFSWGCLNIFLLSGFVASLPLQAQSRDSEFLRTNPKFVKAFRDIVAKPSLSTVRIYCNDKPTALGMVVREDGYLLTKANDLDGKITCKIADQTLECEIVGIHQPNDVALLKVNTKGLVPVEFKESKQSPVGNWVACVGPGDDPVAIGVVSVGPRKINVKGFQPKNLDLSKSPYLGVALDQADNGARVMQVLPKTAASKAGMQPDDVILSLDAKLILGPDEFVQEIQKYKIGDMVKIRLRRGDNELELSATLEKRPPGDNRGDIQNKMGSELSSRRFGYPNILQHDSVIRPVDCGGPLVDLDGKVIGLNVCRAGRTESWAVPSEVIQGLLPELMSGKWAPKK